MTPTLSNSLSAVITNATLLEHPFHFIHIPKFFPPELYSLILQHMPPADTYQPLSARRFKAKTPDGNRMTFLLQPENIARLSGQTLAVWHSVYAAIDTEEFKTALLSKLAPAIAKRFGLADVEQVLARPSILSARLCWDKESYYLAPHRDKATKITTLQIYLPADDQQKDIGTSFFVKRDDFVEVQRFPFLPNSGYAFAIQREGDTPSWHGCNKLHALKEDRHTLLFEFVGA
jgi:hypothetical protein